jgi:hypothetical protein
LALFAAIMFLFLFNMFLLMLIGPGRLLQIIMYIVSILSIGGFIMILIGLLTKSYLKINNSDVYNLAKATLKEDLFAINSKALYEFWPRFPKQFQK